MPGDLPKDATVRRIVESSFDFSMTLGRDDRVEEISTVSDFPHEIPESWTDASFYDVLTPETRQKARELVERAREKGRSPPRHLNLSFPSNVELPVDVSAVRLGRSRRVLALGTSLRGVAEMQQRLIRAQQDMERDYWKYRNAETRYQALFALSGEPLLLMDWESLEVIQTNEALRSWLGRRESASLEGEYVPSLLAPEEADALRGMIDMYREGEAPGRMHFTSQGGQHDAYLRAVESGLRRAILLRLASAPDEGSARADSPGDRRRLQTIFDSLPDGLVVLDDGGSVRWANPAFLDMVQLEPAVIAEGPGLARWLQGPGAGAAVLLSTLADRRRVRLYRSNLVGELGVETEVEISGSRLEGGGWVLAFRVVAPRLQGAGADAASLGTRVSELSGLLGTVGLKELVGSVGELVERHLISAALEATGGNRTAAAELLMLSRQTLYTKLRELELDDSEGE